MLELANLMQPLAVLQEAHPEHRAALLPAVLASAFALDTAAPLLAPGHADPLWPLLLKLWTPETHQARRRGRRPAPRRTSPHPFPLHFPLHVLGMNSVGVGSLVEQHVLFLEVPTFLLGEVVDHPDDFTADPVLALSAGAYRRRDLPVPDLLRAYEGLAHLGIDQGAASYLCRSVPAPELLELITWVYRKRHVLRSPAAVFWSLLKRHNPTTYQRFRPGRTAEGAS